MWGFDSPLAHHVSHPQLSPILAEPPSPLGPLSAGPYRLAAWRGVSPPKRKAQRRGVWGLRHAGRVQRMKLGRYGAGARFYDVLSLERPVYRIGRSRAIDLLHLQPGDQVLDIGCGTGLNLPLLRERVGTGGTVVGVDASAAMLDQAKKRCRTWENVTLLEADAGQLDRLLERSSFDAVIVTYALSIITDWQDAWAHALALTKPGARVAVVDLALPTGLGRVAAPAARFACFTGGVDLRRKPWTLVEDQLTDVTVERHRQGHIVVAAGTAHESAPRSRTSDD